MNQLQALLTDQPLMPGFVPGRQTSILALNAMAAELAGTDIPVLMIRAKAKPDY